MKESLTQMAVHAIKIFMGAILKWQWRSSFFFAISGCLLSLMLLSGCHKPAEQKAPRQVELEKMKKLPLSQIPAGPSTEDAIKFLIQLRRNGQLPDTEDASPHLDFHVDPFATNYPMSRTFIVKMTNSHFANHYVLVKTSADGSWHVKNAWQTDTQGKTNKIYSIE